MKRTTRALPIVLAALVAIVIAACSAGGGAGSPSPSAPGADGQLDGRTFLSTGIQGAQLVPGTQVRLTFSEGNQLNLSAGCNIMGGQYSLDGDRFTTAQLSMTEMACEEPKMLQDDWLSRFVSAVQLRLDGDTLTLTNGNITLTLLDEEVASPDQPVEGTLWALDGIVTGDAVSSVPVGVSASIRIVNGEMELHAGCNQGGGSVTVEEGTLTFGPLMLTKMACEQGPSMVESAIVSVLNGPVAYSVDADALQLTGPGGSGLIFRASR